MATEHPDHCEIAGCRSVYCGTTSNGTAVHKCGKADILIEQNGRLRGVCQRCYTEITDHAGTSRMAELKNDKGEFDSAKIAAYVPNEIQAPLPMRMPDRTTQPIGEVLFSVLQDPESFDSPPDWFGDRP